jgi:hypothetical protein
MDLREVWWEGVDWTHLTQDRYQYPALMNTVMNHGVPLKEHKGNSLINRVTVSF